MNILSERNIILTFVVLFAGLSGYFFLTQENNLNMLEPTGDNVSSTNSSDAPTSTLSPEPQEINLNIPDRHVIPQRHHTYQTFNNCGPATLSMALSYWGINISQNELGNVLRPHQVANGINDDKSVTLQEVAEQATEYGLYSYLRPNGTPEKLQEFISQDIPVVARTWLEPNEDIGHYRVIRGYDRNSAELIQDDSLQGENLTYSYDEFSTIWQPFNYEYLIIVDESKKEIAEKILGEELSERTAWENALERIEQEMSEDPDNWHLTFAKSRIHYYLGEYQQSVNEFEKVENRLSFRTLWYQIEPIRAYYELGNYDKVFAITDSILNNENRAFSELYHIRGQIYLEQGNVNKARSEFENALRYKHNYQPSIDALNNL